MTVQDLLGHRERCEFVGTGRRGSCDCGYDEASLPPKDEACRQETYTYNHCSRIVGLDRKGRPISCSNYIRTLTEKRFGVCREHMLFFYPISHDDFVEENGEIVRRRKPISADDL